MPGTFDNQDGERRKRGWILVVLLAGICLVAALRASPGRMVETDMFALLPTAESKPVIARAVSEIRQRLERKQAFLVSAPDPSKAAAAARWLADGLRTTGLYATVLLEVDIAGFTQAAAFYAPYRGRLMAPATRDQLVAGKDDALVAGVLRQLYSPLSTLASGQLRQDPFLVFDRFLKELGAGAPAKLTLRDGMLGGFDGAMHHLLIQAELVDSPFALGPQEQLAVELAKLRQDLRRTWPSVQLASSGVADHAIASTGSAKREISTVGLGSLIGIVVIQLLTFGGLRPLGAVLVTVAGGIIAGFATCVAVFTQVHLLTLIAGSSLIGISVDYAFHFLADRFRQAPGWSPHAALDHVLPGILLGLITSLLGFVGLGAGGFPGLQQIAVFSGAGLIAAFSVIYAFGPALMPRVGGGPVRPATLRLAQAWLALWRGLSPARGRYLAALAVPLGGALIWGLAQLASNDDVRLLHSPDARVEAEAAALAAATGFQPAAQFFLVEAADEEALLAAEERFRPALAEARRTGAVAGFRMVSSYLPSRRRQEENLALMRRLAAGDNAAIDRLTEAARFAPAIAEGFRRHLTEATERPLAPADWLASPASKPLRHLWLGKTATGTASIVVLEGVHDLSALAKLAAPGHGIYFVDHVALMSDNFTRYRERAALLLGLAYLVIAMVLAWRYGWRGMLACLPAPLGAAAVTLGLFGLAGVAVNLFHIVALTLVLGMGVDYVIFCREAKSGQAATMLAILLSALSTQLAFGLLAFSNMPAVHGFGLTVLIGMTVAYLLAPLARYRLEHSQYKNRVDNHDL